jgi:D-alanine--poly(phosphoribitol) ligase subunit 1
MRTIWDVVESTGRKDPAAIAVHGKPSYTYQQLLDRSDALYRAIRRRSGPGGLIALMVRSPAEAAVSILASARAGCAVLPLARESPRLHRERVLADARPALLIRELGAASGSPGTYEVAVPPAASQSRTRDDGPPYAIDMDDIAYVIYTSGSTGRPKGVMVSHDALLERLAGLAMSPGFGRDDSILAMTAISFDISMAELLLPLSVGGSLVAAPDSTRRDPAIFADVIVEFTPSVIQATPSFWRLALAWGWRGFAPARIWCGGEALTSNLAAELLPVCAQLWNLYGPTEATIYATAAHIEHADDVHLGDPLPGTGLYLEDESGSSVEAPGSRGEIVLYGAGLARGYLNQGALTAERFRESETPAGRRRCYHTGDIAVSGHDGRLLFAGRTDSQVKLRGHRIELGELEAVAESYHSVLEAAALLRDADQPERAHIEMLVVTDGTVSVRDIRQWLAARVQPAMLPGRISIRPGLPRTVAGKLDRSRMASEKPA